MRIAKNWRSCVHVCVFGKLKFGEEKVGEFFILVATVFC